MPRRTLFSSAERTDLLRPPNGESELARHYSFSETDLALIRQRRGDANRLGFAAQLCLLRYPGQGLMLKGAVEEVPTAFLHWIGSQLGIDPVCWPGYFLREATRREHLLELRSYPRQNGLAVALREVGRIERTLFILTWLQSTELRRRVHAGLNKGEARNALARAVFFHRLGEIRDRSFDQQRYRASGLSLVIAAIVLWNTAYLERASRAVLLQTPDLGDKLLQFLSPLGWEHINLSGDYLWGSISKAKTGKFRPLRRVSNP